MGHLVKYLKNYKKQLLLGPFFKLLEAIFEVAVPFVMAGIIDNGINKNNIDYIISHCILLIVFAFAGLASACLCQYFAAVGAYGFGADLKSAMYKHINSLGSEELDKFGTSALALRINNDANLAQTGVNQFIRLGTRAPFLIIGSVVASFILDPRMALIFVITAPIIAFSLYKIMHYTIPKYSQNQRKLEKLSNETGENIAGTRIIRAFSRQNQEIKKFSNNSDNIAESVIAAEKVSSLLNPLSVIIMNIATAIIICIASQFIFKGSLKQGELTAFINYMTQISLALVVLANLIVTLTKGESSARRCAEILETEPKMRYGNVKESKSKDGVPFIEFRNVSFAYPNASENSLDNISFKIFKGESMGIIGGTGSGKSTVLSLILREYDVSSGEILINGINIKDFEKGFMIKNAGFVPQKNVLFSGSIAENMRFRKKNASENEIKKALYEACALNFVERLPNGIESIVTEGGKNFSGGQRQRLCIARAMMGDSNLLMLDDSMSALDFATDLELRRHLSEDFPEKSVIIVSQRAVSLSSCNKVLVLENGKQTGFDSPEKLLEKNDEYREIYNLQTQTV